MYSGKKKSFLGYVIKREVILRLSFYGTLINIIDLEYAQKNNRYRVLRSKRK